MEKTLSKIKVFSSKDIDFETLGNELENLGEDELISIEFSEKREQEEVNNGEEN